MQIKACEQILIFQKLKDEVATLVTAQSCPASPKVTCLDAFNNLADQHFYGASSQDTEQLSLICKKMKGTFIHHLLSYRCKS